VSIVWQVKVVPVPEELEEGETYMFGLWEPFAVFDDSVWLKAQIHSEHDEARSSTHQDLGEKFAIEDIPT